MTVVQADGQNIKPVSVDEFRIATARNLRCHSRTTGKYCLYGVLLKQWIAVVMLGELSHPARE